jgi:chemotaxis protein methyltransferase CheR
MTDEEFALLSEFVRERLGLDLLLAHRDRIRFRLRNRLEALSLGSFLEYYHYLRLAPAAEEETSLLAEALTNGETYLFREAYQFRCFFETVGPAALEKRPRAEPFRVLSAGCSSGEEAYSIAVTWHENRHRAPGRSCRIDAVDVNPARIRQAEVGLYEGLAFRATPRETKERYFVPEGGKLRVKEPLRSMVHFRVLNLLELGDGFEPESFDAIFCRNVFIYFDEALTYRICGTFHKLLRKGGALFLGHSESLLGRTTLFLPQRAPEFIYYVKADKQP